MSVVVSKTRSGIAKAILTGVTALLVWSGTGCRQGPSGRCAILIVLDAARADRFSCYGYPRSTTPNIDALDGAVFLNHFVQRTHTRTSLPTMLFSRYFTVQLFPSSPILPLTHPSNLFTTLDEQAISLPAALSQSGFVTAAISTHRWLRHGTRFAAEHDELYDLARLVEHDRQYAKHKAPVAIDWAISWLAKNRHRDRFLYLHLMDTHFPHYFEQDAADFFGTGSLPVHSFDTVGRPKNLHSELEKDERGYLDALYDGSLRYTDRHIGRLISYLDDSGQLDETLMVITSDHGEHLLERPGYFEHGGSWYDAVARVPLIISYPPKLQAGHHQLLTEGVDILPTVLSLLDAPLPTDKEVDGTDLMAYLNGQTPHRRHVIGGQTDHDGAIRSTGYKAMFDDLELILSDQAPAPATIPGRLFDLRIDPLEVHNLWSSRPAVAQELLEEYRRLATHSYRRHLASVTGEQPRETFAIALRDMHKDSKPEPVKRFSDVDLDTASPAWMESVFGVSYGVLGMPAAPSLRAGARIPNGTYQVSLVMAGQCSVSLMQGVEAYRLRAQAFNPKRPGDLSLEPVGLVEISEQWFSASLTPGPADSCFIRCFAFQPLRPGQVPPPIIDENDAEILRALGYL
jgi:arylsulfatase A-like enzyme